MANRDSLVHGVFAAGGFALVLSLGAIGCGGGTKGSLVDASSVRDFTTGDNTPDMVMGGSDDLTMTGTYDLRGADLKGSTADFSTGGPLDLTAMGPPDFPPGTCTEITTGTFKAATADGTAANFIGAMLPDTGAAEADQLSVQFYGSSFDPSLNGENTGTFDLTQNGDSNYATCSRCFVGLQDPMTPGKVFFPVSGTLTITATSDQLNGTIDATATDVTFVEVTIDSNSFASTPVPGGACLHLATGKIAYVKPQPGPNWKCDPMYFADGSCDCGCGELDPDCSDATSAVCDYCDDTGSCSTAACPGTIDPANNLGCM
jgi:hypothetical protein